MRAPPLRGRFAPLAAFGLVFLAVEALLRLGLLARAWPKLGAGPGLVAQIFASGLLYDGVALSWVLVPGALWLAAVPRRIHDSRVGRDAVHVGFGVAVFVLLFSVVAEWLFWGEFASRFNFIAVDYLVYTREVVANIRESYPVAPILAPAGRDRVRRSGCRCARERSPPRAVADAPLGRRPAALLGVAGAAALGFVAVGATPAPRLRQPLRQGAGEERALRAVLRVPEQRARLRARSTSPRATSDALGRAARARSPSPARRFASDDPRELARDVRRAGPEQRLNVVLVVVESLSARIPRGLRRPSTR